MLARLLVILHSADEADEQRVKDKLKAIDERFSYSPSRNSPYSTGVDFFAAGDFPPEDIEGINQKLTDFYLGDYNSWSARDFNATLFDSAISELQFEYFDD